MDKSELNKIRSIKYPIDHRARRILDTISAIIIENKKSISMKRKIYVTKKRYQIFNFITIEAYEEFENSKKFSEIVNYCNTEKLPLIYNTNKDLNIYKLTIEIS